MNPTTSQQNPGILLALSLLMALTRYHHEGTAFMLPDASAAVFFLAGNFLNSSRIFVLLLVEAFIIDFVAIAGFGVSDYCISPAYAFLIPTYGVMWAAGQWFSRQAINSRVAYATCLVASLLLSASVAFLISNGSFYWFSGKASAGGLADYIQALSGQFLSYLGATTFFVLLGVGVASLLRTFAIARRQGLYMR